MKKEEVIEIVQSQIFKTKLEEREEQYKKEAQERRNQWIEKEKISYFYYGAFLAFALSLTFIIFGFIIMGWV